MQLLLELRQCGRSKVAPPGRHSVIIQFRRVCLTEMKTTLRWLPNLGGQGWYLLIQPSEAWKHFVVPRGCGLLLAAWSILSRAICYCLNFRPLVNLETPASILHERPALKAWKRNITHQHSSPSFCFEQWPPSKGMGSPTDMEGSVTPGRSNWGA